MDSLVQIVFGWPGAVAGLLLLVWGCLAERFPVSLSGFIVASGFCVYIAMNPFPVGGLGLAALVGNGVSVAAVKRGSRWLAAVCLLPFVVLTVYVALLVRSQ